MTPAVSIVIPCYRCKSTIAETVSSVLAQSFDDWECILVPDDGMSYLPHLREAGIADDRIREHPDHADRTGTVAPRNRGMAMVRGELVADLDADDVWRPTRLERLVPVAHSAGYAFDTLECFAADRTLGLSGPGGGDELTLAPADILHRDFPFHPIVRRDLLNGNWFWHDSFVPDVYRAFWLSTIADIVWVQEPLLRYRIDPASMSQSLDGARRIDADYARIIAHIAADEASRFTREQRAIGIAGFERKRALNARYLAAFEAGETRAPFLQWLLEDQA